MFTENIQFFKGGFLPRVKVRDGENFEQVLRRFKKSCEKFGTLSEIKKREYYEKPSVYKKEKNTGCSPSICKKTKKEQEHNMPTSLKDQIMADMKSAMKSKDQSRLQALKLVYAECKNQEIELQKELTDIQVISILKKQIKHYEESIEQFKQAGRSEDAKEQEQRKKMIYAYLPEPLSQEELKKNCG